MKPAAKTSLAGHKGNCAKVTQATITGKTDARCTCGAIRPEHELIGGILSSRPAMGCRVKT